MTCNGACVVCQNEKTKAYNRDRWHNNPEWRRKKVATEKARRKIPIVNARERAKNAARARAKRLDPIERAKDQANCRRYYHEVRKHQADYRETKNAHHRTRRARKSGLNGTHTKADIDEILRRQKYKCAECGASVKKRANRHVDHVMPLALGGSNDKSNLQVLCPPCNLSKSSRHPLDFARSKGRLL